MKRILAKILCGVFFFACMLGLVACGKGNGEKTSDSLKGSYVIHYYFENTDGDFVLDATKDETGEDEIGKTISVRTPKTFDGYVFDEQNPNNRKFDIIREEATAHLELYYKLLGNDDGETPATGTYVIKYYLEDAFGVFAHDATKDVRGEKEIGETVTATPDVLEDYVFDEQNTDNVISGTIVEGTTELKLHYKRTMYAITVTGGTASKTEARWGETVTLTLESGKTAWELVSGEGAVLNGNELTVGKSDVVIRALDREPKQLEVLDTYYVRPGDQEVKATLTVVDGGEMQGLVNLYNTENTLNSLGAKESYYLFATKADKAYFYIYWGGEFLEVKSADITPVSAGAHEYKMSIAATGDIVCSLDDGQVLTVAVSDFTAKGYGGIGFAGRVGTYNESGVLPMSDVSVVGEMSVEELKAYFNTILCRIGSSYYVFNTVSLNIENIVGDVPFDGISGFGAQTQAFRAQINACNSIDEFLALAENCQDVKLQALKAHTLASLGYFIQMYNDSLLMPLVSGSQVATPYGPVMSADVFSRDTRWWVPNAYMLYSSWPEPEHMGVMDMLESEVASTNDYNAIYNICNKYITDIVRALSCKGFEYYYWQEYNKDPNSVVNEWWFLWPYFGDEGEGFEYVGNVFEDYTWTKDYRLCGVFYNKAHEAYKTDLNAIKNDYAFLMYNQTTNPSLTYTVTLNAMGGTVDTETLTGTYGADLALPTPTKTGATFGGWYTSRAYEGTALTAIAGYTNKKDITLYAKWIENDTEQAYAVDVADIFGNHMIIQRNKAFNVFGTGTDGAEVTVSFAGETRMATIENGKWSVQFPAMDASWEAKTLTVTGAGMKFVFTDILVGEVWLGTGQSNMQMTLSWMNGTGVNYIGQYGYYDNFSKIRIYRQQIPGTPFSGDEGNSNNWVTFNNPNEAHSQSAYSISFALNLQKTLGIPVGVINSCQGATYIEEWLSTESLAVAGSVFDGMFEEPKESRYYYGMTELLRGISVAGVIWYQGEGNAFALNRPGDFPNSPNVDYADQLKALHNQYKDIFGDEKLPMIVTELAPYAWDDYEDFRLTQRRFVTENANTYLLSTVDLGTPYDIHPVYKNELGKRAANIALEFIYQAGVTDSLSYIPVSATKSGDTITLSFESGKTVVAYGALIGFKVENDQGVLVDVQATVVNNQVVINFTGTAVKVYYMYVKTQAGVFNDQLSYYIGQPTLYGGNGLPVGPFAIAVENA